MSSQIITLIETDPNRRGDLFSNLITSLFGALGYEKFRLNIHKSGREIDLQGVHRTERKQVVAECKATDRPIGGDDINKFVGAFDAERRKTDIETIGYFVSLSGFTETAIEQEREFRDQRVILLDAQRIRMELINGRVVVPTSEAYAAAGRCASDHVGLVPEEEHDLLAHSIGFVWSIYFSEHKNRTHFSLIHADGQPLAPQLAQTISSGLPSLAALVYLPPKSAMEPAREDIASARREYLGYLDNECGAIQLEGLPADEEVGSQKLRLEHLFVPSHMRQEKEERLSLSSGRRGRRRTPGSPVTYTGGRLSTGDVLRSHQRIALLGLPGSGKSTLLKRLAIGFAFPERRALIDDNLPELDVLPLFVRCRQLGGLVRAPISEILFAISRRAEMDSMKAKAFESLVSEALRGGKAMLLVDGLDEIADEGDRLAFVTQLRTFLATYQAIRVIVTSRQAGFRIVGAALAFICKRFSLAEFDDSDIERLTVAWHVQLLGDRAEIVRDARLLSQSICREPQVRQLAETPLLLTTLLLVRRWVRNLPTKRTTLYAKAIEILLMTWNVEGHEPLDQEEVLPQLQYVAFQMMKEGVQRISTPMLSDLLRRAREEMPEILGYARTNVTDLIKRVELRSSLLVLAGHDIVNGAITPMYEFRHLTFQEYLAAKAITDGTYPARKDSDTPLSVLNKYLDSEPWREVVLSTCIISGRRAAPIIKELVSRHKSKRSETAERRGYFSDALLTRALADEVQMPPELVEECIRAVIQSHVELQNALAIYAGKYGPAFEALGLELFTASETNLLTSGSILASIQLKKLGWLDAPITGDVVSTVERTVESERKGANPPLAAALIALGVMELAFLYSRPAGSHRQTKRSEAESARFIEIGTQLSDLLRSESVQTAFAAAWAIVWIGHVVPQLGREVKKLLRNLLALWQKVQAQDVKYVAAWGINSVGAVPREEKPFGEATPELLAFLVGVRQTETKDGQAKVQRMAALISAYYLHSPYSDAELASLFDAQTAPPPTQGHHFNEIRERLPKREETQGSLTLDDAQISEGSLDDEIVLRADESLAGEDELVPGSDDDYGNDDKLSPPEDDHIDRDKIRDEE